ncbi:MAG: glycosyltransferase family 4 protein [Thermoguttaceae bacterium]
MSIGIVTTWEERGAAYVSKQYIEALRTQFSVKVFARGGTNSSHGSPLFKESACHRSKASNRIYSTYIRKREFLSWIERNRIEIVFFNEQNWWPPVVWCKQQGIRIGAYVDYYTLNTMPYFRLYDLLICNTQRHHSAFDWHPHAYYVPWGTDVETFAPRLKETAEKTIFFHSCGLSPERKGTDLLLKAFADLPANAAQLIIHSQRKLQDYASSALGCTNDDLTNRGIRFIEQTVSAPGLYHLGQVYVYPTRLEGIGLTILEALSCGLPVIVPDDGPMNEFVTNERGKLVGVERRHARADGYYWPMNVVSVDDLRRKMLFYVENPFAILTEATNARDYAKSQLDWRERYPEVIHAFEDAMSRPVRTEASICQEIIEREKSLAARAKRFVTEVDSLLGRTTRKY